MKYFTARELMSTQVVVIETTDTMQAAFDLMRKYEIRHLPVVAGSDVVGLISDRDVQRAMAIGVNFDEVVSVDIPADRKVSQFMSSPLVAVDADTTLQTVAQRMIDSKISAVVVHEKGEIVGLISHEDLLRLLVLVFEDTESLEEEADL